MSPSLQTMGFFMSDINFCNTKEQLNHLGEVVTGKVNGSPTGADIGTSTLPYTGQVRRTLPSLEVEYEQSITDKEIEADAAIDEYRLTNKGPYASGITLESKFEYITYNGESYFATNPPYTTTATLPDADANLFVGVYQTKQNVLDEIQSATVPVFNSIVDMKLGKMSNGNIISLADSTGLKVQWLGYYEASDGGSNWGIVKQGAHAEDGGSIFTITPTLYVEANITSKFNIKKFGVLSDGSQDDVTDRFEAAIALRKKIKCDRNSAYNLGKIVPDGFTWIDFNHSTVNLIPNTNAPLFYDSRAGSSTDIFEDFTVLNLKYNGNQEDGNNAANANGCIWLSNWKNVRIENLEVDNCMRIGLNIRGCDGVKIHDYTYKNGGFDTAPTYSYGWTLEETSGNGKCRNIDMKNIKVESSRGYGGHFNGCQKAVIKNYETIGLNYLSSSISFTITSSNEIDITNYTADQTSGDSLEVNDSTSVTLDNWTISNSGNRGIVFGDNNTGSDGSDVTIRNGQITGSANADLALNRVRRLSFENMRLAKGEVSVIGSEDLIRASDISFANVEFNSEISSALGGQYRFAFRNCSWLDIMGVDCSLTNDLWSSPKNNTDEEGYLIVPAGGAINLPPLSRISRVRGPFIGELRITSAFSGNTDQHSLITYYLSKISTSLQITQGPEIYGSVTNRKMTVTQGVTSDDLVLTNNTTGELRVVWALHTY